MPSKIKSAPERLREKFPHLQKVWAFLESFNKESDRGAVLIATGYMEEMLKKTLVAFMVEGSISQGLLDGANAPLGTFSARIAACAALGLIDADEEHDFNLIRRIRNQFAHNIDASFDDKVIIDRCRSLKLKAADYEHSGQQIVVVPRGHFMTASISLLARLHNRAEHVGKQRRRVEHWPSYDAPIETDSA